MKYIDNGNIGLDLLNRSKLHLNREILKTWHHIENPANKTVPILKPVGPSSIKNSNISDNQLHTMQENPTDSIRKLKLSNPHKIILGHLDINSLRNKFESIADVIQGNIWHFSFIRN